VELIVQPGVHNGARRIAANFAKLAKPPGKNAET
jgi:hypothetical protein